MQTLESVASGNAHNALSPECAQHQQQHMLQATLFSRIPSLLFFMPLLPFMSWLRSPAACYLVAGILIEEKDDDDGILANKQQREQEQEQERQQ